MIHKKLIDDAVSGLKSVSLGWPGGVGLGPWSVLLSRSQV